LTRATSILWPERYKPEAAALHVRKELEMPVSPETAWAWLVRAEQWPTWCPEFKDVVIRGGGQDLKLGTEFRWKAFGVTLDSKVEEFAPFERLAWSARFIGVDAYHAWLIERLPQGCRVVTEETQNGWVARLNNTLRPGSVGRIHQAWLERLLRKAKDGAP
jgi:Polyketide cyclase / dehydrase and lipid transport